MPWISLHFVLLSFTLLRHPLPLRVWYHLEVPRSRYIICQLSVNLFVILVCNGGSKSQSQTYQKFLLSLGNLVYSQCSSLIFIFATSFPNKSMGKTLKKDERIKTRSVVDDPDDETSLLDGDSPDLQEAWKKPNSLISAILASMN